MVWWVEMPACNPDMNSIVAHKVKERNDSYQSSPDRHVLDHPPAPRTDNKIKTKAFSINKKTNVIKCGKAVN